MVTTDLARFELDKPLARIKLGAQEFSFGATQPLSNQLYVHTQGAVYLISPVYFIDAAQPAQAFISNVCWQMTKSRWGSNLRASPWPATTVLAHDAARIGIERRADAGCRQCLCR